MWWPSYQAFLKSAVWQGIRQRIKQRDGWRCRGCGSRWRLEVHHMTYRYGWGREPDGMLLTLCRACHAGVTAYVEAHRGEAGEVQLTLRFLFERKLPQ